LIGKRARGDLVGGDRKKQSTMIVLAVEEAC
jgi:hypothetical protein